VWVCKPQAVPRPAAAVLALPRGRLAGAASSPDASALTGDEPWSRQADACVCQAPPAALAHTVAAPQRTLPTATHRHFWKKNSDVCSCPSCAKYLASWVKASHPSCTSPWSRAASARTCACVHHNRVRVRVKVRIRVRVGLVWGCVNGTRGSWGG